MSLGPIEMLCIKFPDHLIKDEIATALRALVENKTIRVIDILFIHKSESGEVTMSEIDELDDEDYSLLDPIITDITGLIAEADVETIAQSLDSNSFAALMLFENIWAIAFRDAVVNAEGQILLNEQTPSNVIKQVMAEQAQVTA